MADTPVTPIILTDCLVKIGAEGGVEYQGSVSQVEYVPTASTTTWKGLSPDSSHTFSSRATWVVTLAYAQDWASENSLSGYLFDHEGETVPITFEPKNGGQGFTSNVSITPGSIGGTVDSVAVGTVSLGSDKPTRVASTT